MAHGKVTPICLPSKVFLEENGLRLRDPGRMGLRCGCADAPAPERLVARVLDRLQDRVELVLADQVRSSMAPVLDHVVTRLATELRDGLQLTVEQVVARAVAQELAHLRTRS